MPNKYFGVDFLEHAAHATPLNSSTNKEGQQTSANESYPTTQNTVTFGTHAGSTDGYFDTNSPDFVDGVNPSANSGTGFVANTGLYVFRLKILDETGTWTVGTTRTVRIWIIVPSVPTPWRCVIYDTYEEAGLLEDLTIDRSGSEYGPNFYDILGNLHAVPAATVLDYPSIGSIDVETDQETLYFAFGQIAGGNYSHFAQITGQVQDAGASLSVTDQPADTVSGVPNDTVVVESSDNTSTATVTATLVGGSTLSGTTTAAMVAGVATFTNLIPTGANTNQHYHFAASGHTAVDSDDFDVTSSGGVSAVVAILAGA